MSDYRIEEENNQMQQDGIECFIQMFDSMNTCAKPHIHTAVEILYILHGDFRVTIDETEHVAHPGDTVLIRSNAIHQICSLQDSACSYYVVKLKPAFILDISSQKFGASYLLSLSLQNKNDKNLWTNEQCQKNRVAAIMDRLKRESEQSDYCSDIAIKICAAELLLALLRDIDQAKSASAVPHVYHKDLARRIYDATVFINKHYPEDINAQECSRYVHLSYSYFSRNFKRLTGKTFTDYLNIVRINRAEKALASSQKSISEIAADCGFNTVSYFISKFREKKGITPSAYREQTL